MAKNKIWVGPADGANAKPLIVEGLVVDDFSAGELLKQTASGLATSDIAATVFGEECLIAQEIGAGIGGDIDTKATVGDTGFAIAVRSGEFVNVRVATGNNITTKGVALSSAGDGQLKIAVTPATVGVTSEQVLFFSDEIINVAADQTLVRVRKA